MNLTNKRIESLAGEIPSCSNSPIKHKRYRLPLVTILIIALMLTSSFLFFFSDKLFTSPTTDTQPNIPPITTPYSTPELLWKTQVPGGSGIYPVVLNEVVFSYRDYNVYGLSLTALNVTNGDIIWQTRYFETGSAPSDINNIIYTQKVGSLIAWNAKDGTEIWNINFECVAPPVVVNGVVYAVEGGAVVALKATDGTKIWNDTYSGGSAYLSPAVANGIAYVGSGSNHTVYALDALDGKLLWEYTTNDEVNTSPAVANGIVYVGSDDYNLYALNAKTGEKIWSYKTGGKVGSPVVKYGVVYVCSDDHKVYAINAQTGKEIWTHTTDDNTFLVSTPAVANGIVYTISNERSGVNGALYALNAATGEKLWSYQQEERFESLVIVDNKIYITTYNSMHAFSTIQPLDTP
jgi:outer membrane protein assembly factor BamB